MNLNEIRAKYSSDDDFLNDVENEVLKLAENNPNFVYVENTNDVTNCDYFGPAFLTKNNQIAGPQCSGCIFGQALQNMGWTKENDVNYDIPINMLLGEVLEDQSSLLTPKLLKFNQIQFKQDLGISWGNAVNQEVPIC